MFFDIACRVLQCCQNQVSDHICSYVVLGAFVFKMSLCLAVSRAGVIILCIGIFTSWIPILILFLIAFCAVVKHFSTTVCAKHESGQWICLALCDWAVLGLSDFLNHIPRVFINNSFLCIPEYQPVLWISILRMLVFIGFLERSKIYSVPHIFRFRHKVCDGGSSP